MKIDFHQSSKLNNQCKSQGTTTMQPPASFRLRTFAALAALPLLAACDQATSSTVSAPERPVQVQRVAFENETPSHEFVGVVRARYETDFGFRVAGKIIARTVNVGDVVHV